MKTSVQIGTQIQVTIIESQWGDSEVSYKRRFESEFAVEEFKKENNACKIVKIEEVPLYEFV